MQLQVLACVACHATETPTAAAMHEDIEQLCITQQHVDARHSGQYHPSTIMDISNSQPL
jgi:hypothetical protein